MDQEPVEPVEPVEPNEQVPTAGGSLIEQDAIRKIDAGAQLIHMLYHHPRAKDLLTSDFATPGFVKAYGKACEAYGVGGC